MQAKEIEHPRCHYQSMKCIITKHILGIKWCLKWYWHPQSHLTFLQFIHDIIIRSAGIAGFVGDARVYLTSLPSRRSKDTLRVHCGGNAGVVDNNVPSDSSAELLPTSLKFLLFTALASTGDPVLHFMQGTKRARTFPSTIFGD